MLRHKLSLALAGRGMNFTSCEADGVVTSTKAVPLLIPRIAYSRPLGLTYPHASLALVAAALIAVNGNHACKLTPDD